VRIDANTKSFCTFGQTEHIKITLYVIPAQAGIHSVRGQPCGACGGDVGVSMVVLRRLPVRWVPACAGKTIPLGSRIPSYSRRFALFAVTLFLLRQLASPGNP
jgi:hypothetical protein